EMFGQRCQVVSVMIHVMSGSSLRRAAMAAAVVGDDAIAVLQKEHHLRVPVVGGQRPAVAKDDGLTFTPVLVEDLNAVSGRDRVHDDLLHGDSRGLPGSCLGASYVMACAPAAQTGSEVSAANRSASSAMERAAGHSPRQVASQD